MKKLQYFIKKGIFLFTCFILTSCILTSCLSTKTPYQETTLMLGTVITGSLYGKNAEPALKKAFQRGTEIEEKMSVKIDTSEVSKINMLAGKSSFSASPETFFVIQQAVDYANKSQGNFDPCIGHLIDLWGIGTDHAHIPKPEELLRYTNKNFYQSIQLDSANHTIFLTDPLSKLDLGGIAKGYTADEMKRIVTEDFGIKSGVLNLGGNILTIGTKPDGSDWVVGIKDPLAPTSTEVLGTIKVHDKSIVTSGNYERFFKQDGKIYHHILNPFTGFPAESGILSSTIISSSSLDGDALSTAVFILGKEKGLKLIESVKGIEAIIVTSDHKIYTSSGIDSSILSVTHKEYEYVKNEKR